MLEISAQFQSSRSLLLIYSFLEYYTGTNLNFLVAYQNYSESCYILLVDLFVPLVLRVDFF